MYKYAVNIMSVPEIIDRSQEKFNYRTGKFNYRTDPRSIIKFPDSARNRNPEEYKGTVFYRTFVLLAPFYNSGTRCIPCDVSWL